MVQLSHPYTTAGKTITLTRRTFVGKVMSLLFSMLSSLVIAFLPRSKHLAVSWLQSPSAEIFEPKKIKYVTVSIVSPSICHEGMGPDTMIFIFECCFKSAFSLSSFTFIKSLFNSSSLSAIRVVSSAYLRLLIFLLAILIPACASFSSAFCMWCSAYISGMPIYNLDVLLPQFETSSLFHVQFQVLLLDLHTVSQEAGKMVWYSHLFKNFPQFAVIHTIKGFGVVNKAEVDVFLELSCFFCDPADVGNLISGSSAFSKSSLNIWKFTVHVLLPSVHVHVLKPHLENFEHYFASV